MRKRSEILNEIAGLAKKIGLDSYECAALQAKIQQVSQRIQGNLARMQQLDTEQCSPDEVPESGIIPPEVHCTDPVVLPNPEPAA